MRRVIAFAILPIAASAAACGLLDPRPDPSRYFVLASFEDLGSKVEPCTLPAGASVGLGPVHIPEYLDEPSLLTRSSPTELTRSIDDRWAEPLNSMLPRVLSDDLTVAFGNARIETFPWYATDRPAWQIELEIERFEPNSQGEVLLVATARLSELDGEHRSVQRDVRISRHAASLDPRDRAQALSEAVGALAEEMAHAVCELARPK